MIVLTVFNDNEDSLDTYLTDRMGFQASYTYFKNLENFNIKYIQEKKKHKRCF